MTNDASVLDSYNTSKTYPAVSFGDGTACALTVSGNFRCITSFHGTRNEINVTEVSFVPGLMCRLMSLSRLRRGSMRVSLDSNPNGNGICIVTKSGD